MEKLIVYFTPALSQLAGFGALLAVVGGLFLIGKLVRRQTTLPEIDLIAGWSLCCISMIVGGGFLKIDMRIVAAALAAAALCSAWSIFRRRHADGSSDLLRTLLLSLPLLWLTAAMMISQWDEFTHWMPNARYLVEYHTLPGPGNPAPTSNLPGYPHALAFVVYLASVLTGQLAENVSAIFTIVLMAFFAVTLGRIVRDTVTGARSVGHIGWTYCAVGALAITGLNPTFVPKIVFTAYADTPTMVLVGMLCVLMWLILNTLAGSEDRYNVRSLAWSFGLVAMAAVGTKQPNIVMCGLIVIGGLVVAIRDPEISVVSYLRLLPAIVLPALVIYISWRLHIETNHIEGEFNFLDRERWMIDQIDVIAGKMLTIASKKGGYFGIMLIACLFAVRALWRIRTPFDRLSLIVATLFTGYVSFLLFVYVTAFGGNGLVAPSFWRFNMHLGGACVAFGIVGVALLWRQFVLPRFSANLSWLIIALLLIAPFAISYKIRFDLHPPTVFVRNVSEAIVRMLPKGSRIVALDVTGNGEFEVIARYVASPHLRYVGFFIASYNPTTDRLRGFAIDKRPEYMWVHVPTAEIEQAFDVTLKPRHAHLVKMDGLKATVIQSWPYPGYDNPNTVPD